MANIVTIKTKIKKKGFLDFADCIRDHKNECKFLDTDYKKKMPQLVLGNEFNHFKKSHKVLKIQHQTGGIMCHQHYFYGIVLPMSDFLIEKLPAMQERFNEGSFNIFSSGLSTYNKYNNFIRAVLKTTGCEETFFYLEEAIYPFDYNKQNLGILSKVKFDKDDDISEIFENRKKLPFNGAKLFLLTENSD